MSLHVAGATVPLRGVRCVCSLGCGTVFGDVCCNAGKLSMDDPFLCVKSRKDHLLLFIITGKSKRIIRSFLSNILYACKL